MRSLASAECRSTTPTSSWISSRTLAFGLMPVGAVLGGLVAEHVGLAATFYAAVAVALLACGYLASSLRTSGLQDAPEPASTAATV